MKDHHKMRVWDKALQGFWIQRDNGYFYTDIDSEETKRGDSISLIDILESDEYSNGLFIFELCLGEKDKNGKLIYESDKVEFDDGEGWPVGQGIITHKDFFGICHDGEMYSALDSRITKIIGNIHQP